MEQTLRILNLEDNPNDTELIQARLEDEGYACEMTRIETEAEFISGLDRACYDLLLVDYKLPSFDGMSALKIAREKCPDVPFIFVSGSIGEDLAIEAMKNGATDYVLKQRLARLGPAVTRAMKEKREREALRTANRALEASEEQLRHAQKMEAIGTLAGGIAHDFNNILNVIIGYGNMISSRLGENDPMADSMKEILAAAERAANLTKRLLVFSRKQVMDFRPVDMNEIVRSFGKMLTRILGEDISLKSELREDAVMVMADAGQIEQVLMNLAANARDAMPKGGSLIIKVGDLDLKEDRDIEHYGAVRPGRYALVTVTDTGHGMDAELQRRIFEPFFTTKSMGEGTGLGLAISYGIVEKHNGYLLVSSEPGKGTTFSILLPEIREPGKEELRNGGSSEIKGGSETILIAEDDPSLRKLISITLESFGYTVIAAADGNEAINKFMENRENVDLLIFDMIMPHRSGKEAYEEIRKADPGIRLLLLSGYSPELLRTHELLSQGLEYLPKPISPRDLLSKVRSVLDRKGQ